MSTGAKSMNPWQYLCVLSAVAALVGFGFKNYTVVWLGVAATFLYMFLADRQRRKGENDEICANQ